MSMSLWEVSNNITMFNSCRDYNAMLVQCSAQRTETLHVSAATEAFVSAESAVSVIDDFKAY